MKKYLCIAIAAIALIAFVACDGEPSTKNDANVEKKEIFIPGYSLTTSKGMTQFPSDNPFVEMTVGSHDSLTTIAPYLSMTVEEAARYFLACNAMSSLPMLPSFEKHNENPEAFVEKYKSGDLKVYGFDAKVKVGKVNEDGIYLFIVAYEDGEEVAKKPICAFEYYYSWANKTFSYREIVAAFMNRQPQANGDVILLFEMYNVPVVDENGKISFTAGVKNGDFDPETQIKLYKVGLPTQKGNELSDPISPASFREFNVILKQDGTALSAGLGYEKYQNQFLLNVSAEEDTSGVYNFLVDSVKQTKYGFEFIATGVDTGYAVLDDDSCNIEFAFDYLSLFFNGFNDFLDEESFATRTAGIDSMSKFNSLKYTKDPTAPDLFRKYYNPADYSTGYNHSDYVYYIRDIFFPVMYSIESRLGTTSDMTAIDSGLIENSAGESFVYAFGELFGETYGMDYDSIPEFEAAILQQCGVTSTFTPITTLSST